MHNEQDNKQEDIVDRTLEKQVEQGLFKLQPHEKIVNNKIVEKTIEEQINEGLIILTPEQKIENGEIVPKTMKEMVAQGLFQIDEPFQYIEGETRKKRSIKELVENGFIKTFDQCERVLSMIDKKIETKIGAKYPPGYELKLTKRYIDWINNGKPEDNRPEKKYTEMQAYIEEIKKEYKPFRAKVKEIMGK